MVKNFVNFLSKFWKDIFFRFARLVSLILFFVMEQQENFLPSATRLVEKNLSTDFLFFIIFFFLNS